MNKLIFDMYMLSDKAKLQQIKQIEEHQLLKNNVSSMFGIAFRSSLVAAITSFMINSTSLSTHPFLGIIAIPTTFSIALFIELNEKYKEEKKLEEFKYNPIFRKMETELLLAIKDRKNLESVYSYYNNIFNDFLKTEIREIHYETINERSIQKMLENDKEEFKKNGLSNEYSVSNKDSTWLKLYSLLNEERAKLYEENQKNQ